MFKFPSRTPLVSSSQRRDTERDAGHCIGERGEGGCREDMQRSSEKNKFASVPSSFHFTALRNSSDREQRQIPLREGGGGGE